MRPTRRSQATLYAHASTVNLAREESNVNVLVLGGTHFVGRHAVEEALARRYTVTIFNRGLSNPQLYPEIEHLVGDRSKDMRALRRRSWDLVIDPSAFYPEIVRKTCEVLRGNVGYYIFISSAACYDLEEAEPPLTESSPLRELDDPANTDLDWQANYGPLKAACEAILQSEFDGPTLIIRPGLIVGPEDLTDRFTYWPRRISDGGDVLVPCPPNRPIQVHDARDLTSWIFDIAERGERGTFNTAGRVTTVGELLERCRAVTAGDAEFVWVDESFLVEQGVKPWTELPLWMPGRAAIGVSALSTTHAERAGFTCRPIDTTIRDTWTWDSTRPRPLQRGPVGARYVVETLEPQREAELLNLWRSRQA